MGLDIRWPMGLLFLLLGAILAVYGLVSDPELAATQEAVAAETVMGPLE